MSERKTIRVWATKWALTMGIVSDLAKQAEDFPEMVVLRGGEYLHKPDWHESLEAAQARVREMIAAKRKSIAKQLAKLDRIERDGVKVVER